MNKRRIIVGVSGASGACYAITLLRLLRDLPEVETHLVLSKAAKRTITLETQSTIADVEALADHVHACSDIAASIASGSFVTDGMVVLPCSMKTVSGIANAYADNLLIRAADVTLKERRRLILMVRETPLHLGHLRLLTQVTEMGAIVMPPVPAFYHHPESLNDLINQTLNRLLDLLHIPLPKDLFQRWAGANP